MVACQVGGLKNSDMRGLTLIAGSAIMPQSQTTIAENTYMALKTTQQNQSNRKVNWGAQSALAKLLARERLSVVVDPNASTASFQLKDRILTLPNWNVGSDTFTMLTAHEASHALHTPFKEWEKQIKLLSKKHNVMEQSVATYINVIEDVRIEKLIKRAYPGLKFAFFSGYQELNNLKIIYIDKSKIGELSLIDKINMYFKVGHIYKEIKFDDTETTEFIYPTNNAELFSDVIDIVDKLLKYEIERGNSVNVPVLTIGGGAGSPFSDYKDAVSGGGHEATPVSVPASKTNVSNQQMVQKMGTSVSDMKSFNVPIFEPNVFDYTYLNRRANRNETYDPAWSRYMTTAEDRATLAKFDKYWADSRKVVQYMSIVFNKKKRAAEYNRSSVAESGRLDPSRLWSYQLDDKIFKNYRIVKKGKNHGLLMYVDWSGSMQSHVFPTARQLVQLAMFCRQMNIPFEAYLFCDPIYDTKFSNQKKKIKKPLMSKPSDISNRECTLVQIVDSTVDSTTFKESLRLFYNMAYDITNNSHGGIVGLTGTPLNECMMACYNQLDEFKAKNKLEIVNTIFLTDGDTSYNLTNVMGQSARYGDLVCDNKNKHMFSILSGYGTDELAAVLSNTFGVNVIGMYLTNAAPTLYRNSSAKVDSASLKKQFDTNGFFEQPTNGYTKYYVLNSNIMAKDEPTLESLTSKMFINKFIDLIS